MFGLLIVYFLLAISGFFFSFHNKRFEETLPLTIGGIILFLYIFYIFNLLNIGYYLLIAIFIGVFFYSIYLFVKAKNKKEILSNFFTPGFIIYSLSFVIIYIIVRNRQALLWDELRLWGAYPKILYYDGSLQLGNSATLFSYMQSYEPGMPLFQFFVTKSALNFKEGYLFFAYALLCLSAILPFTKKITFKQWYLIPVFTILILFIPLALANSYTDQLTYYYTLYIEPALGIFFGYTLYLSTKKMDNRIDKLIFYSGLATLVLLKDTGIIFASVSCLSYFFIQKKREKQLTKKKILSLLIPLFMCLSIFGSWKLVQKINSSSNMYASKIKFDEVITFFTHMSEDQKKILGEFWDESTTKCYDSNFDGLERYINFYTVFAFILILMVILIYLKKKKDRHVYKTATLWYAIGSVFFVLGTLALYLFSLHTAVCFVRYSSVVLTGGIIFLILVTTEGILGEEKKLGIIGIYLALFFILITPLKGPVSEINYYINMAKDSEEYTNTIVKNVDPSERLLIVSGTSTIESYAGVIYDLHIFMNLIDEGYINPQFMIYDENYDYTDPRALFIAEEGDIRYDYIYFFILNEEDKDEFESVLNERIESSTLYKVENNQLIRVYEEELA